MKMGERGAGLHPGVLAAAAAVSDALHGLVQERLTAGTPLVDPFRGMHLDDTDVQRLLARPSLASYVSPTAPHDSLGLPKQPHDSPFAIAMSGFALEPFEVAIIALCLLPEIDGRYGSLIGFLHDDMTRKAPSVDLALALFAPGPPAHLDYLHHFLPEAPLCAWHLLRVTLDEALIRQSLQLDRAFLWYLLGAHGLDRALEGIAYVAPEAQGIGVAMPPTLAALCERDLLARQPVLLYGEDENTCLGVAAAAACAANRPLLVVDGARAAAAETGAEVLARALRDAVLRRYVPCITHAAALLQSSAGLADELRRLMSVRTGPLVLIGDETIGEMAFAGTGALPVSVPLPVVAERAELWREVATSRSIALDERTLLALSETTLSLSRVAVADVADAAASAARASNEDPDGRHLGRAARHALRKQAGSLALITPRFDWSDIILPTDRLNLLRHLCSRVRYRSQVRETWGVGGASLPGVTALFAGQPGTGKSMAAEIVAADLGLDIYKIDLAQVVSKYIGETEKNLSRIFNEAEQSGVVLVFDEADALFGKRSDVKDSHDRYANLEISYLLQRMERYRGLAILTTNLRANLDEAFTRRIGVSIDFPMPGPPDRLRIWQRALAAAPHDPDLDLQELAERLELAGGAIVNVAVTAAHLAAEEKGPIDRDRLLRAVRWELQKMGRLMAGDALDALVPVTAGASGSNGRYR